MLDYIRVQKDEIVIGGMLVLMTFIGLSIYSVVLLKTPFSAMDFGGGAAAILGAIGGGQGVRDWLEGKGDSYAKPRND
jgi:hypothetical protein